MQVKEKSNIVIVDRCILLSSIGAINTLSLYYKLSLAESLLDTYKHLRQYRPKGIENIVMAILNGFKIIGISVRTTNENNKSASDIGTLWRQFYSENLLAKIPNKISNDIYSIYTDYKGDFTDDYTTIIGMSVTGLDNIPEGLIGRQFDAENFTKFTAKGQMPQAVIDIWADIWGRDKELRRKYSYDFEVYNDNSQKEENSEVEIYIATNIN